MLVSYQYTISYGLKFLEKVKTEQKQYAPIIWGHKYTGNKEQFYIQIYISSTFILSS